MAKFIGEVRVQFIPNTEHVILLEDFGFMDDKGKSWMAKKGLEFDGASIPRILWSVAGGPYEGPYRRAAVLHDAGCRYRTSTSREVNRMFYDAMIVDGTDADMAMRMYTAVRLFGPHWPDSTMPLSVMNFANMAPDIDDVEKAIDQVLAE